MKKLIFWALVLVAGWYAWTHKDQLFSRQAGHEAVVENQTGGTIERLRLTVDGQTLVKESLAPDESARFSFKVTNDSDFKLVWLVKGRMGERRWSGGLVSKGPLVQRHILSIDEDGGVTFRAEHKM